MTRPKLGPSDFALLGGSPHFPQAIPVGQLYFPSWERYETTMRAIFERGWYTNHGPLAQALEQRLARFFGVRHAITTTNGTIGLVMAAKALGLTGKVVVPGFTFVATAQAMTWAGLDVVFCDVDRTTHQVTPETVAPVLDDDVTAIVAVNLWGGACDPVRMASFAREVGVRLFFDSAHGAGVVVDGTPLGGFGDLEVFSFHATKIVSASEGGCVCTNDDDLAARLRNIRSSYGAGPPVDVPLTSNGRFSEAQAALALMSLDDYSRNRSHNEELVRLYSVGLEAVPGIRVVLPSGAAESNYQYAVVEVDKAGFGMTRDALVAVLRSENLLARRYFHPGVHRTVPYCHDPRSANLVLPNTERLSETLLQLPVGALVTRDIAQRAVELIAAAHRHARLLLNGIAA